MGSHNGELEARAEKTSEPETPAAPVSTEVSHASADEEAPAKDGKDSPEDESASEGEVEEAKGSNHAQAPPLPDEAIPGGPPLPDEPVPTQQEDDGWDCQFDPNSQAWYFVNRFTGQSQWENPRVPDDSAAAAAQAAAPITAPLPPAHEQPVAGGYNPAIHGDYDPNAWYAQADAASQPSAVVGAAAVAGPADPHAAIATFNRFTGQFQSGEEAGRHTDEAKSRRQMNAFFDVDAAANAHNGMSLKAERSNKKPSKAELKAFKEKRRARKEEKRRAWLRD